MPPPYPGGIGKRSPARRPASDRDAGCLLLGEDGSPDFLGQALVQDLVAFQKPFDIEGLLAWKVEVEGPRRQLGLTGNSWYGGACVTVLPELTSRSVQDLPASADRFTPPAFPCACVVISFIL
jgi:hypothetical protein